MDTIVFVMIFMTSAFNSIPGYTKANSRHVDGFRIRNVGSTTLESNVITTNSQELRLADHVIYHHKMEIIKVFS